MRELVNVVNKLMEEDQQVIKNAVTTAMKDYDRAIHNLGNSIVATGQINSSEYKNAKAARYVYDLIHSVECFIEEGNQATFTIGSSLYPNAESFDWDEE
jgi:hypothetical protein